MEFFRGRPTVFAMASTSLPTNLGAPSGAGIHSAQHTPAPTTATPTAATQLQFRKWYRAFKPDSWPKIWVPMALGQAIALDMRSHQTSSPTAWWPPILWSALMMVPVAGFIVLLNDWSDQRVDSLKRRMFPQSSPKTIHDQHLSSKKVLVGALICATSVLVLSLLGSTFLHAPALPLWAMAGMGLFAMYSLPPIRLNYRGGGEFLEALGIAIIAPMMQLSLHGFPALQSLFQVSPQGFSPQVFSPQVFAFVGYLLLAAASATASGLSDERSDMVGGKRTLTTWLGNHGARRTTESLYFLGALIWATGAIITTTPWRWALAAGAVLTWASWSHLRNTSSQAVTDAFGPIRTYKKVLHQGMWRGAIALAAVLPLNCSPP